MTGIFTLIDSIINYLLARWTQASPALKGPLKFIAWTGVLTAFVQISALLLSMLLGGLVVTDDKGVTTSTATSFFAWGILVCAVLGLLIKGLGHVISALGGRIGFYINNVGSVVFYGLVVCLGMTFLSWVTAFDPISVRYTVLMYGTIGSALLALLFLIPVWGLQTGFDGIVRFFTLRAPAPAVLQDKDKTVLAKAFSLLVSTIGWFVAIGIVLLLLPKGTKIAHLGIGIASILLIMILDLAKERTWKIGEKFMGLLPYVTALFIFGEPIYDTFYCGTLPNGDEKIAGSELTVAQQCVQSDTSFWDGTKGALKGLRKPAPKVQINFPNGTENLMSGEMLKVQWQAQTSNLTEEIKKYKISFSTDGGNVYTWPVIVLDNPASIQQLHEVQLPSQTSTTVKMKVEALNAAGDVIAEDESDANFSLTSKNASQPTGGSTSIPPPDYSTPPIIYSPGASGNNGSSNAYGGGSAGTGASGPQKPKAPKAEKSTKVYVLPPVTGKPELPSVSTTPEMKQADKEADEICKKYPDVCK